MKKRKENEEVENKKSGKIGYDMKQINTKGATGSDPDIHNELYKNRKDVD
ncbi:hypothetical protein [Thermohalobacter berrensis]|nr:hypothetical protein [Thermohalobacter berrensis]